jgi:hypothetical protein
MQDDDIPEGVYVDGTYDPEPEAAAESSTPKSMGLSDKTALIGIVLGGVIAVLGVAMPLGFDVPPLVWRSISCVGMLACATLLAWLLFEHFVRTHPNASTKRRRSISLIIGSICLVGATIWIALAVPQPKNYGELILAKLNQDSSRAVPHVPTPAPLAPSPAVPAPSRRKVGVGDDNTIVNAPVPPNLRNGNTIIGATDANGNAIYNKEGTAYGKGACAGATGVAIGAGATNCGQRERAAARLKVIDFSFGAPDANGRVQLIVRVKNQGMSVGDYPVYGAKLLLSDSTLTNLSREAPYQDFLAEAVARPPGKNPTRGQMEIGDEVRDSINGAYVTKDEIDAVRSGAKRLNIFVVMKYRDLTTARSEFWVSEYCAEQAQDFRAYYECDTHNLIWLHK